MPNGALGGYLLVRTIGSLRVNSTDAALSVDWNAAIALRNDSNVPVPGDEQNPWVWQEAGSALPATGTGLYIRFDVKSKRLFRNPQSDLLFIMANQDSVQSLEYVFNLRMLFKLP